MAGGVEIKPAERPVRVLDLGCGSAKHPEAIGIDAWPFPGVDIVRDLRRGLPFDDNTVGVILAKHILEHFDGEDLTFIIEEMCRVCVAGAYITVILPDKTSPNAGKDFTHKKKDWDAWSFQMWEVNASGVYAIQRGPLYHIKGVLRLRETSVNENLDRAYLLEVVK